MKSHGSHNVILAYWWVSCKKKMIRNRGRRLYKEYIEDVPYQRDELSKTIVQWTWTGRNCLCREELSMQLHDFIYRVEGIMVHNIYNARILPVFFRSLSNLGGKFGMKMWLQNLSPPLTFLPSFKLGNTIFPLTSLISPPYQSISLVK